MKLNTDSETLAENKVILLYILNKINKPINNSAFFKLVTSLEDMNYFYFQQFLLDLVELKYIINYQKDEEFVYEISKIGKEALALTKDIIPGILKFKIDNELKEELDIIEDELSVVAQYTPESENNYIVKCKIVENNVVIFEVKIFAGSREQAKKIADNWKENAISLYPKIIELLN